MSHRSHYDAKLQHLVQRHPDSISRQDIYVFRITRQISMYDMGNKRRLWCLSQPKSLHILISANINIYLSSRYRDLFQILSISSNSRFHANNAITLSPLKAHGAQADLGLNVFVQNGHILKSWKYDRLRMSEVS